MSSPSPKPKPKLFRPKVLPVPRSNPSRAAKYNAEKRLRKRKTPNALLQETLEKCAKDAKMPKGAFVCQYAIPLIKGTPVLTTKNDDDEFADFWRHVTRAVWDSISEESVREHNDPKLTKKEKRYVEIVQRVISAGLDPSQKEDPDYVAVWDFLVESYGKNADEDPECAPFLGLDAAWRSKKVTGRLAERALKFMSMIFTDLETLDAFLKQAMLEILTQDGSDTLGWMADMKYFHDIARRKQDNRRQDRYLPPRLFCVNYSVKVD